MWTFLLSAVTLPQHQLYTMSIFKSNIFNEALEFRTIRGNILNFLICFAFLFIFFPNIAIASNDFPGFSTINSGSGQIQGMNNATNTAVIPGTESRTLWIYKDTYPGTSNLLEGPNVGTTNAASYNGITLGAYSAGDGNYYIKIQNSSNSNALIITYNSTGGVWSLGSPIPSPDTSTRIISFSPPDNSTTTGPFVDFDFHAYINQDDLSNVRGVKLSLDNIDQNVILLGFFSPNQIELVDEDATTSGDFYFSTTTTLGDGNYRLEACIERTYFNGWIFNPFSPIADCQSHQFIVGNATFIGNISQSMFTDTNNFLNGLTATSSEALASTCNPLSGNFEIRQCVTFLLIPDAQGLNNVITQAREGIFTRIPWGYFTRVVNIMTSSSTEALPSFTATIQIGPGDDMTPETTSLTFDMGDIVSGGGELLDSIQDPIHGKTVKDIFYPFVQATLALGVIFTIVADISRTHQHNTREPSQNKGKKT